MVSGVSKMPSLTASSDRAVRTYTERKKSVSILYYRNKILQNFATLRSQTNSGFHSMFSPSDLGKPLQLVK